MRIALDYASNWEVRGGVWRYGVELSNALATIASPSDVIVPCYDRLPADRFEELTQIRASIKTGTFSYYDTLDGMAARNGRFIPWSRLVPAVYRPWMREYLFQQGLGGADVYHAIFTCRGKPKHGATVGTIHDLIPFLEPEGSNLKAQTFALIANSHRRFAQLVIVPSEATKRDLIQHLGFPADRIRVIYHGINTTHFHADVPIDDALLARHGLRRNQFFLYVGALEGRKNLDRLIAAYRAAVPEGVNFPLVLAGSRTQQLPVLERALTEQASGVRHIGYLSDGDLPGLYRAARALVHPALIEGFGFTPLEAMACGTPAVVHRATSTGEVVGDGGVLIDATDVESIASALRTLKSDGRLVERLGHNARDHVKSFTWERCARQTHQVYQEAHSRWRQTPREQESDGRTRATH